MATVRQRGQLLLIGALALAISLVAIALVLNSAIYTHNLASRYDSPGDAVIAANGEITDSAATDIRYVNDAFADQGYSDVTQAYRDGLGDIESEMAKEAAVSGHTLRLTDAGDTQGVRIVDEASGGSTFYPATGTPDKWTVADDARVRSFRIRDVPTSSLRDRTTSEAEDLLALSDLTSLGGLLPAFIVVFDDGTTEYRVALYDDTTIGGPTLMVHETGSGNPYLTCTGTGPVSVDFAAGTFDGTPCAPLGFIETLSGDVDVRYYYGDEITGKYRLVADARVDGTSSEAGPFTDRVDTTNYPDGHCDGPTYYAATSSSYPRISPAIYSVDVGTTYQSDRVEYQGTRRVAPKEPRGVPQSPRITSFDVDETDSDSGDGEFTVTWSAVDPNGDAVDTTIEVVEPDGQTKAFSSPGSSPASVDVDDESGDYVIRLVVDDGPDDSVIDGNSRSVSQTHADDGDESGCPP